MVGVGCWVSRSWASTDVAKSPRGEPNRYAPRGTQKPHAPRPTPPPYPPRDPSHISHLVKLTGNHTPGAPQNPRPHTRADPSYPRPAGRVVRRGRHLRGRSRTGRTPHGAADQLRGSGPVEGRARREGEPCGLQWWRESLHHFRPHPSPPGVDPQGTETKLPHSGGEGRGGRLGPALPSARHHKIRGEATVSE